jgi:hypothetical protein
MVASIPAGMIRLRDVQKEHRGYKYHPGLPQQRISRGHSHRLDKD